MRLLGIRAQDPPKYALALMDAVFTDEEMGTCCFLLGSDPLSNPSQKKRLNLLKVCY